MSGSEKSCISGFCRTMLGLTAAIAFIKPLGMAQESETAAEAIEEAEITESIQEDESVQKKIVVTGSRIKRSAFTSIAPVQVINTDFSREIGLINSADILQEDTAASGQQINDTFQGFVLDNGPGSQTISLRGLGAGRALALINGRRMAPIGVEGAPADASVNFIPSSFVSTYEILLDGASSVYGSDAVAGVVNAVLRNDYDGFEIGGNYSNPQDGGGEVTNIYGSWGKQMDRGFIAVAVDYEHQNRIRLADRDWSAQCERIAEVTPSGEIRTVDLSNEFALPGMGTSSCGIFPLGSRISVGTSALSYGSLYYTPEFTNTGINNFSESSLFGVLYDGNGDGLADFSFYDYTSNGTVADRNADLVNESTNMSVMLTGDYQTDVLGDAKIYGELMYVKGEFEGLSPPGQIFESVPGSNPFNPCNPDGLNGQDCGAAIADYYNNTAAGQAQSQAFVAYGGTPAQLDAAFGVNINPGPIGPLAVLPIVGIRGDRDNFESELAQTRFVAGIEGALGFINYGSMANWTYDASLTFSRSEGTSKRVGIREDRLLPSLNTSTIVPGTTDVVCGVDVDGDGIPDGALADGTPCVPVNFFADSVLGTPIGDFASQAERDYLFGERTFDTTYEQTLLQVFATGDLFELPGGIAAGVVGVDYRRDKLDSDPNDVARDGLFWGFFADRGAKGEMDTFGIYGELELPLLAGETFAEELSLNLSARYTDTEFAGTDDTYSVKLGWRPVNSLLIRATYGTSFRAPNVREQFLEGQSGFSTLADPCFVPGDAYDPINGYDATQDQREQTTLDNCVAAGLEPKTFGQGNFSATSVEVFQTGSNANPLKPEESESYSYGFVFEQPFTSWLDATLGITYYNLEITEAIRSQSPQFIVYQCYVAVAGFSSPLCANISRDDDGFLNIVNYEYENIAVERASGFDINLLVEKDFAVRGRDLDVSLDVRANKIETRNALDRIDDPSTYDSFVGEFYYPEWSYQATLRLDYDDFRFTWAVDWQSGVEQDDEFVDEFGSFVTGGGSVTCLGPTLGDELCREIGYADEYVTHDVSLRADFENWQAIFGVKNLFDQAPPFVSPNEVFTSSGTNYVPGAGYDPFGRTYFFSMTREF